MENHIENNFAELWIENDILFFIYKENSTIDLKAAMIIVEDRLSLHQGRELPILCDIRGIVEINKAARDYLAIEGSLLIKEVALVVAPPITQLISKFYLRTSNPPINTEVFLNKDEAIKYLSTK